MYPSLLTPDTVRKIQGGPIVHSFISRKNVLLFQVWHVMPRSETDVSMRGVTRDYRQDKTAPNSYLVLQHTASEPKPTENSDKITYQKSNPHQPTSSKTQHCPRKSLSTPTTRLRVSYRAIRLLPTPRHYHYRFLSDGVVSC